MADKKLNEVTKVTDMAYVPVIMADGSIGQIAKADLASVVAGLIGGFLDSDKQAASANSALSNGIYYISSNGTSSPLSNDIGTVVVFRRGARIVQHYYSTKNNKMFIRFSESNGSEWSSWVQII